MSIDSIGSGHRFKVPGRVVQTAWLLFVLLAVSLALAGAGAYREILQTPCVGGACLNGQLGPAETTALLADGKSLAEYASVLVIIHVVTDVLLLFTAGALIWRKPAHGAGITGAFLLAAAATAPLAQAGGHANPALTIGAEVLLFVQWSLLLPFFALIPDGRFRPGWLLWAASAVALLVALAVFGFRAPSGDTLALVLSVFVGMLTLGSVVYCYRVSAGSPEQEPLAWTLAALGLLAGAVWIGSPLRLLPVPAMPLASLPSQMYMLFPLFGMLLAVAALTCLGVALLGDELFRVDVALNRAIVYGALTLFVVGGYVLIVGYLSLVFQSSGSFWFSLIATGIVAALFQPIRARVQRFVNRMIYGEPDDPYTMLAQLGRRLETAIASEDVAPAIVHSVKEGLKVTYAAIAYQAQGLDECSIAAESGQKGRVAFDLPLVYKNETIGRLMVGARSSGAPFSDADQRLLNDLSRRAGAALHAARQNTDLQIARQHLVTAREEERRRLRRDLHDGLGASLAALNLQAGELKRLIPSNPARAAAEAEDLREGIRAAIADIRHLVYGLRPPALDELGLVEALRARGAQTSSRTALDETGAQALPPAPLHVTVDAPDDLPPLPAAVEAAAYRIAVEALTNVIQYANATQCSISITSVTGGLSLEICDDGDGLSEGYRQGVGLISMRERCAELGGSLTLNSAHGLGTRVHALLPLIDERPEE